MLLDELPLYVEDLRAQSLFFVGAVVLGVVDPIRARLCESPQQDLKGCEEKDRVGVEGVTLIRNILLLCCREAWVSMP